MLVLKGCSFAGKSFIGPKALSHKVFTLPYPRCQGYRDVRYFTSCVCEHTKTVCQVLHPWRLREVSRTFEGESITVITEFATSDSIFESVKANRTDQI